jgi:hypothetical protein
MAKGLGDLWGGEFEDNKLYVATQRPPHIMNLARLIGPASAINPLRPVAPAERVEYDVVLDPGDIPVGVNEFNLRDDCNCEPPINYIAITPQDYPLGGVDVHSSIATALQAISTDASDTVFQTKVASRILVASAGDYYVDTHGNVLTYERTGNYSAVDDKTYQTTMAPDMYDQATLNVIPDMNQSTSDGLCDIISLGGGEYVVRTPYLTKLSRRNSLNNPLEPGGDGCPPLSFATTERARLPYALKATDGMNLNDGDQIPDGFMGLWDETDKRMISGLTFKLSDEVSYDSDYCVIVSGATLTVASTRYRIVTVGTTITETLSYLVRRMDTHNHDDRRSGYPVNHANLMNKTISPADVNTGWSIEVESPPSTIQGNDHPQYLCRYGWQSSLDAGQYDNAMLGDLFMGAVAGDDYITNNHDSGSYDSRKIIFGFTTGPSIYYDTSDEAFTISAGAAKHLNISVTVGTLDLYSQSTGIAIHTDGFNSTMGTDSIYIGADHGANLGTLPADSLILVAGGGVTSLPGSDIDSIYLASDSYIRMEAVNGLRFDNTSHDGNYISITSSPSPGSSQVLTLQNSASAQHLLRLTSDSSGSQVYAGVGVPLEIYAAGTLDLYSEGELDIISGNLDIDVTGIMDVDATNNIDLDAGNHMFLGSDNNIYLTAATDIWATATSGEILLTATNCSIRLNESSAGELELKSTTRVFVDTGVFRLANLSVPPPTGYTAAAGDMYFDTSTDNKVYVYNGSTWKKLLYE